MRILLLDDDRMVLLTLARALKRLRPDWQVRTAANGPEALAQLREQGCEVLVSDLVMPEMDGLAVLAEARKVPGGEDLQVILATSRDDRESMRAGMTAGADDYLTKPYTGEEVVAAAEGRLRRRASATREDPEARALRERLQSLLSPRELEILACIGEGLGSKEIAARLGISPRTVDVHRGNLMRKVDLHNAPSLAALAIRANLP